MKMKFFILFQLMLLLVMNAFGQQEHRYLRKGNKQYEKHGDYKEAEIDYRKALNINSNNLTGIFNLGDALYQQKQYSDAADQFQRVAESTKDKTLKAKAYHNLGNSLLKQNKYKESVEAYENALRQNPSDMNTKYNLSYALSKLKEQQKKNQQNKQNKKNQNQNKKNQNKQKQNQNKQNQQKKQGNKKQQQQQQQQQNKNGNKKKQQQAQANPQEISKKDAEQILKALQSQEKAVQLKMMKKRAKGHPVKTQKNW